MMCRKVQFMIVVNYTFFIFANHYKCVNKKTSRKDVNALFTILNDKNDKRLIHFCLWFLLKDIEEAKKCYRKYWNKYSTHFIEEIP